MTLLRKNKEIWYTSQTALENGVDHDKKWNSERHMHFYAFWEFYNKSTNYNFMNRENKFILLK